MGARLKFKFRMAGGFILALLLLFLLPGQSFSVVGKEEDFDEAI